MVIVSLLHQRLSCISVTHEIRYVSHSHMAGCPLCMEDMDVTDKNFRPCKCGYQICLFCYNKIKDNHNGACPACRHGRALYLGHHALSPTCDSRLTCDSFFCDRTPYDEANAVFVTPDPTECVATNPPPPCGAPQTLQKDLLPERKAFPLPF